MKTKPVKTYKQFKSELNELRKINEGLIDSVKSVLSKIGKFFSGIGSKFLNALIKQHEGSSPSCVTIIPSNKDLNILSKYGIKMSKPSINILRENEEPLLENEFLKIYEEEDDPMIRLQIDHETNIGDVDGEGLQEILYSAVYGTLHDEPSTPILIWGAPGIGKSAIIDKVASLFSFSEKDMRLIKVDLATMNPEDLFLPYKKEIKGNDENDNMVQSGKAPADWLPVYHVSMGQKGNDLANSAIFDENDPPKYDEKGNRISGTPIKEGGIIFFDEIIRVKPGVKDALLTLLDKQRRIGQYKLGDKWTIIAAANREQDEPDINIKKTYAFLDRFNHYNYSPTFKDWEKWAISARNDKGELIILPEILNFVKWWGKTEEDATHGGGKYFYHFNQKRNVNANPRAWEKASAALRTMRKAMASMKSKDYELTRDEIVRAIMGSVGRTVAEDFANFLDMMRFVKLEDIDLVYTDPTKAPTLKSLEQKFKGQKVSDITLRKIAFLTSVASAKAGKILTKDELRNLSKWLIMPENIDNKLIATFFSMLLDYSHPYLNTKSNSQDQLLIKSETDPDIEEKEKIKRWYYSSPEFKEVAYTYKEIFGIRMEKK